MGKRPDLRVAGLLTLGCVLGLSACGLQVEYEDGVEGVVNVRRLTEAQYRNTVEEAFGREIEVSGRFEPEMREEGLLAVGSAQLSITPSGFQQYFAMAKSVAATTMSEDMRGEVLPCAPTDAAKADEACARQAIADIGGKLFRRPLDEAELTERVAIISDVANEKQDFYQGMALGLASLMVSPDFLFRMERAEAVPGKTGKVRLDGYSKASRLSYFFWDSAPDAELLEAAASGDIHTKKGLEAQVARLASSERLTDGARAFFDDVLHFEKFSTLTKDPDIYPKYSLAVAKSAQEQTLRTLVDHLVEQDGDYRDVFTTRKTFLDRTMAAIYKVPYLGEGDWVEYTIPEDDEREGVLTHVSFLSLFSHPGRSSPTLRGVALNEMYLCTPTPLPPANVDFSIVNDTGNMELPTVRDRLQVHATNDACANCHNLSDPVGLTLENFDSLGQFRTRENDHPIDVRADLWGEKVEGAQGLATSLRGNEDVPACLVQNVFAYGVGRAVHPTENAFLDEQIETFAKNGYRYPALMTQIALTPEFFDFEPVTEETLEQFAEAESASLEGGSK